jgi:hypothetical protein
MLRKQQVLRLLGDQINEPVLDKRALGMDRKSSLSAKLTTKKV